MAQYGAFDQQNVLDTSLGAAGPITFSVDAAAIDGEQFGEILRATWDQFAPTATDQRQAHGIG